MERHGRRRGEEGLGGLGRGVVRMWERNSWEAGRGMVGRRERHG